MSSVTRTVQVEIRLLREISLASAYKTPDRIAFRKERLVLIATRDLARCVRCRAEGEVGQCEDRPPLDNSDTVQMPFLHREDRFGEAGAEFHQSRSAGGREVVAVELTPDGFEVDGHREFSERSK